MKNPQILDLYSDYQISSSKSTTVTGMSELLDGVYKSRQNYTFFRTGSADAKRILNVLKESFVKLKAPEELSRLTILSSKTQSHY